MKNGKMSRTLVVLAFFLFILVIGSVSVLGRIVPMKMDLFHSAQTPQAEPTEGPLTTPSIVVGPFDLHRRYRSMEGPFSDANFRIGDLVAGKQAMLPEATVKFTEHLGSIPSMAGKPGTPDGISTLPDTSHSKRQLYWLKGFKLDVLDESGKPEPTAEFLCHLNIDVDPEKRNEVFPESTRCYSSRLLTLTQGQAQVMFPAGFAVPVASDEVWRFVFQAANRTTDAHRRIMHKLTLYLIADKELVEPITALAYFNPSVQVVVDKNKPEFTAQEKALCALCIPTGRGVVPSNAVTSSVSSDHFGRKTTVHWVVPQGQHQWSYTLADSRVGSEKPLLVHTVWSHIHPCCTDFSFVRLADGQRQPLWDAKCQTDTTNGGLRIEHIDLISSKNGILVPAKSTYQADIVYDNNSGRPLDSMATMGAFFEDADFARPQWAFQKDMGQFCGISDHRQLKQSATPNINTLTSGTAAKMPLQPIFDAKKDGPLLKHSQKIKVETTSGNLTFILEPKWAPKTATQIARLLENHGFDGTSFCSYQPGYILQVGLADNKAAGHGCLPDSLRQSLRRIPLEVDAQYAKEVFHTTGVLSMSRRPKDPLDNSSSFSILLGEAPHLDGKYTIFGKVADDKESTQTIKQLSIDWPLHPYIVKAQAI